MCGRKVMGLLYGLDPKVTKIYDYVMMGIGSNNCFVTGTPCLNEGHSYSFSSSAGYSRSDSVGLLVYDDIRTIFRASVLYYMSLGTTPTLPGRV
jgi:predicted glycosyltransferase involved in capsule biosynthesis